MASLKEIEEAKLASKAYEGKSSYK